MTSEEKAAIEKALEEFGQEPGVQEVAAVLRNRDLLPEALLDDLEMAAGLTSIENQPTTEEPEQDLTQDQDMEMK